MQTRSATTGFPSCAFAYKFTGKERDTESGLDYFGARYYASNMGRWMSPDWADKPEAVPYSQLDNPQSLNLYGYVNNNPLSHADADGHEQQPLDPKQLASMKQDLDRAGAALQKFAQDHPILTNLGINLGLAILTKGEGESVAMPRLTEGGDVMPAAPSHVITPSGDAVPIPKGASGPDPVINPAGNTTGSQYQGGSGGNGMDPKTTGVRIMDPTPPRGASPGKPDGYVSYNNKSGQTVNPQSGRTVSNADPSAHIPLSPKPPN